MSSGSRHPISPRGRAARLAVLLAWSLAGAGSAQQQVPPDSALADPIAADPVFWWRYTNRPKNPSEPEPYFYWPSATVKGGNGPFLPPAARPTIARPALDAAAAWAQAHGSTALIVVRRGRVELERYWGGAAGDRIATSRALSRSIPPLLLGFAVAEGRMGLDDPVGRHVREWADDPRGRITLRQLAQNVSGLEAGEVSLQPYRNKYLRLAWGGDAAAAALDHALAEPPGSRFAVVGPNAQLLALAIERATGRRLEALLSERLWRPIGAADATMQLDRPGGSARAMCCMRATPRDWARLGVLLLDDGVWNGRRVLPAGWVETLAAPSARNPNYGAGIWLGTPYNPLRGYEEGKPGLVRQSEPFLADDVRFLEGDGNRLVVMIPSRRLVIVRLGPQVRDWDQAPLVNILLRGLASGRTPSPGGGAKL